MGLFGVLSILAVTYDFFWSFVTFFGGKLGKNHSKSFYCCETFKLGYLMIFDYILILYMIVFCYSQSLFALHIDCDLFSKFSNKIISMLFQWVWFSTEVELYMTDIKPEHLPLLHVPQTPFLQMIEAQQLKPYEHTLNN